MIKMKTRSVGGVNSKMVKIYPSQRKNLETDDNYRVCGAACLLRRSEGRWQRHQPDEEGELFEEFCSLDDSMDWGLELGELPNQEDSDVEFEITEQSCLVGDEDSNSIREILDADKSTRKKRRGRLRRLSKTMAWMLRHLALALGINMRKDGYVKVSELLSTKPLPIFYSRPSYETEKN